MSDTPNISNQSYEDMLASWRADEEARARDVMAQAAPRIERFTNLAASRGIKLLSSDFRYIRTIGVVAQSPSLARAMLSEATPDKEGLYGFGDILRLLPETARKEGFFCGTDYFAMAHPCYRREMHPDANWAPRFIEMLWALRDPNLDKRVAIDEDRLRIDVDGPEYFERDTWFGAPFNEDVGAIHPGIVKLRPPMDVHELLIKYYFAKCYCLDIKWTDRGPIKAFQALELKTEEVQVELNGVTYFPARYLHAEFDMTTGAFRHFDGAIQYLLPKEYHQRRDADFNFSAKDQRHFKARSQKVFKLNGPLKTDQWVELCCQFLVGNPLTFEYFTGSYPEHVNDAIAKMQARSE